MAAVPVTPGRTEITATARSRAHRTPPVLRDTPGGIYPLKSAAFEVDEYRIMSGWPVPVPDGDIQIQCLVSAEGSVLSARESPLELVTAADMRWVADSDYYDQTTLQWTPVQGGVSPWVSPAGNEPTLFTDYEYSIGDERFVGMTVLNFDSNTIDYMTNDLSLVMGGTSGYTVLMVLSPNSIYGNDSSVPSNALWAPADTSGSWTAFKVTDQAVWCATEVMPSQKGVSIGNALDSNAPTYLALVVRRPQTVLYAASGPSRLLVKRLATGEAPMPLSTDFQLGNDPFPTSATMDMALMDLSIYANPLSKDEVLAEITLLSSAYGGDT
jgi:hypothetical protein